MIFNRFFHAKTIEECYKTTLIPSVRLASGSRSSIQVGEVFTGVFTFKQIGIFKQNIGQQTNKQTNEGREFYPKIHLSKKVGFWFLIDFLVALKFGMCYAFTSRQGGFGRLGDLHF